MRIQLFAAALIAAFSPGAGQPQDEATEAFVCANDLLARGEYLKADDVLAKAVLGEKDDFGMLHQYRSQVNPFLTGEAQPRPTDGKPSHDDLRRLSSAELRDAIPEIVSRARQTNIVILNEEHVAPRDRAFALEVARALRPLGYSVLAAEAFSSSADLNERQAKMKTLATDGYARLKTGIYTKDPVFADFVRQSLALGYRPLVYEYVAPKGSAPAADPIATRDQGEAENLVKQVFAVDPHAKVLIYVGYSHAAEKPQFGNEWMASRLKRMTGVDPLTIDQTTLSPSAVDAKGVALFAALKRRLGTRSVVPMLGGKPLTVGSFGGAVDLQVIHPPARLIRGRPNWLAAMGRKFVAVPARLIPASGRVLVQAFVAGDPDDAVPIDQVIVTAGQKPPPLMLPRGPVRFRVRTGFRPGDCDSTTAK